MTILKKQKTNNNERDEVCSRKESLDPEFIRKSIAEGTIIITKNKKRDTERLGLGKASRPR